MEHSDPTPEAVDFEPFVAVIRVRLRRVLVARFGIQVGMDLTAEIEAWAWENFSVLQSMHNPLGYLYRVAQSKARPYTRWSTRNVFPGLLPEKSHADEYTHDLSEMMSMLTDNQRTCVLLVHAYGWSYREVAETLEISTAAVTNHVNRGMMRLRNREEIVIDPLLAGQDQENRNV